MPRSEVEGHGEGLTWWAGGVTARDPLAGRVALRELQDELDLRLAALLEGVVPRPGAAEELQLAEGPLVERPALDRVHVDDGPSLRPQVPQEGCRHRHDEEPDEDSRDDVAATGGGRYAPLRSLVSPCPLQEQPACQSLPPDSSWLRPARRPGVADRTRGFPSACEMQPCYPLRLTSPSTRSRSAAT